jgi:hypothetical protein
MLMPREQVAKSTGNGAVSRKDTAQLKAALLVSV